MERCRRSFPAGLRLCKWSDSYIVDLDGIYTLYDRNGAVLAGPYTGGRYAESLREVGPGPLLLQQ